MAYNTGSLYSLGGGFTSSCLDDIPFKLGPKFQPPAKVVLPPNIDLKTRQCSALNAEYSFEVEEAVLKYSAERERHLVEQESQRLSQQQRDNSDTSGDEVDQQGASNGTGAGPSEPLYENMGKDPVYENAPVLAPKPVPRPRPVPGGSANTSPYVSVLVPNPLLANISNDILKPTLISGNGSVSEKEPEKKDSSSNFDMTMFEKVDDPFDNLELQTINDMEELASVLTETNKQSPVPPSLGDAGVSGENQPQGEDVGTSASGVESQTADSTSLYENVPAKVKVAEPVNGTVSNSLGHLPPIPARRNLTGNVSPLPPIGGQSLDTTLSENGSQPNISDRMSSSLSASLDGLDLKQDSSFLDTKVTKRPVPLPKPVVPKPPRTFKYSRHDMCDGNDSDSIKVLPNDSESGTGFSVQYRNTQSTPNLQDLQGAQNGTPGNLNFVSSHFGEESGAGVEDSRSHPVPVPRKCQSPPPRPSSGQAWNRFSPLPPATVSLPIVPTRPAPARPPPPPPDMYRNLSSEARQSVDKLVNMGFPKDSVVRAVERLGEDEKEVVEYLCLVAQLTEKGYSTANAESALLLFQNSMNQASAYLELFTQLQELGFNGEKIKEALVNTNNDREKTLDILTASS